MTALSPDLAALLPPILLFLGLMVGSFLNVVIYRLPLIMETRWRQGCFELLEMESEPVDKPMSLAFPNSHCPACNAPIKPWQNVPVISYLVLRGKCASCATAISKRYPILELTTGIMTMMLGFYFQVPVALLGVVLFTWALIALTMIDVDHQLLPDDITLPLLWLGLLLNVFDTYVPLADAVLGAMAGYGVLWSVYWLFKLITGKEGMGYGDFKLLAALGAWMGWQALPLIILFSSVVGALLGIAMIMKSGRSKDTPMPFGPYLAIAGWIALLWGDTITKGYLDILGAN